jgi:spore coat protein U-like protein
MTRFKPFASALIFGAMLWPFQAQALLYTCSVSATDVGFGNYSPLDTSPVDSTGNVRVSCSLLGLLSLLVSYRIYLGTGAAGGYTPRMMYKGTDPLNYNLYTNSARTTIWGDGSGGTSYVSYGYLLGLTTVRIDYTVYGRLPAEQNVAPGLYSDTITVTVEYF